ncbi:MAG TPA: sugar ABC transporter permease [Ktedonobacteraceae bacterium]|jgi:multiple sugar transport system permease protein|nr:sugar ABC transporter permease [Ktedonobacteraceae bacterium]
MLRTKAFNASPGKMGFKQQRRNRNITPYMFLLPATIAMLLIFFYPMLDGLYTSFTHYNQYTNITSFVGFKNYASILSSGDFWNSMVRSVIWVVFSVLGQFVLGFGFALLLNERWPGNRLMRALVMIPWVMPGISVALTWSLIFNGQLGLLNDLLLRWNLPPQQWLADPNMAMVTVIVANIWKAFPFVAVTILAGLASIPDELYDAAKVDGASVVGRFRHVTLPQLRNVILIIVLLMIVWTFNYFDLVYVMTQGGPAQGTEIAPVLVARYAFQQFDYGLSASVAVVMTLFNILFAALYLMVLRRPNS